MATMSNQLNNKITVLGASGFIGKKLTELLSVRNLSFRVGARNDSLDSSHFLFDLESAFDLIGKVGKDDTIIFLAAESSPDVCNTQYTYAYKINVSNTITAIESAISEGSRVIFISSDVVYGESPQVVDEKSELSPLGVYAEMKAEVERYFFGNQLVLPVRLSYVWSSFDRFSLLVQECMIKGKTLDIFEGLSRSVISIDDVTDSLICLSQQEWPSWMTVVNFAGPECLSRKKMAEIIRTSYPEFSYTLSAPSDSFWSARPKIIKMKSKYIEGVLKRPLISYNPIIEV